MHRLSGLSGLFLLAVMAMATRTPAAEETVTVNLRDIGHLTVQSRFYSAAPLRSSWITMQAEDARKAAACGSKYLEDILGYGDAQLAKDPAIPGTLVVLSGTGQWVLGLEGSRFQVVFSRTADGLPNLLKQANAAVWKPVPRAAYPRWMDTFDNAAMTFWFSGFGILPKDLDADHAWYEANGFTACAVLGNTERRLLAPGVVDTSVMDWQSAMAAKFHTPYKVMADMATPARPERLWDYAPLPYFTAQDGQLASAHLDYQSMAIHAGFQAGAATDRYLMDFRRRVAERLKDDPYFIGHHVMQEMPGNDARDLTCLASVAGTPAIQASWRTYLKDVLKYDLAMVGSRFNGDPKAFRTWADVGIPELKEFVGWDASAIDLHGMWEGRADREKQATAEKWFAGNVSDQWRPVDCQDLGIMIYGQREACDYFIRRTFTATAAAGSPQYLHLARTGIADGPRTYDAWLNGIKLETISGSDPSCADWDMCYDVSAALKPGGNQLVINTRGVPVASYIFIGARGKWVYPGPSQTLNCRYFDMLAFEEWLIMRELEDRMIAIRAGDPDRPMKVMAPHNYIDRVLELCARYGAYPHDTGGAGAWWGPFTYSRYAMTRGIPNSAEEGGVPHDAAELQAVMTRYLMMGADAVDNVGHSAAYTGNPGMKQWITDNRELLRCVGKQDLVQPVVGMLRAGRELRFGNADMYAWDMGRGALPSIGRAFEYATWGDLRNHSVDKFKVLLDCATAVMSEEEVDLIERYVRQGGIFIAFHNTGVHTPEKAFAWPISRLTGLRVLNDNRPIGGTNIHFTDTQSLWPKLRGQEVDGWGLVLDWLKQDKTGAPLALASQEGDIDVIATWKNGAADGNIAVASRALGKGRVITLGSTFYRNGKDQAGRYVEPGTLPYLDELLTALGAPRETQAGELWCERWRSKNGLYDVYPVAQMEAGAVTSTTDVRIRRDTPPTALWELSALHHPVVPLHYADGMLSIPQVAMAAMQSRVFAAPRADIERGALYWLQVQQRQCGALPELSAADRQRATIAPATDLIAMADGWRCSTGAKDPAWVAPADASTSGWKSVRLGSFAAMGLPEECVAQFRTEVTVPPAWAGQRVSLSFDAENWFWGFTWRAKLWINGEPAAIAQPLRPQPNGCFAIELTPGQLTAGKLVIALEVDGNYPEQNHDKARPSGVTGTFFLRARPQPLRVTPLTAWQRATDLAMMTPTVVGQPVECMYLETTFTLPAPWPGKHLHLESAGSLGSLFINNRFVSAPNWMDELDVSGLVEKDGANVLRWVPAKSSPVWSEPYKGMVPALNLMWLP